MDSRTLKSKASVDKKNSYQCNNFINHVIFFKSNVLHVTERYKKWSFLNDIHYNITLLFFHSYLYK